MEEYCKLLGFTFNVHDPESGGTYKKGCDSKLRGQKSRPNIFRQRVVRHAERARILPDLRFDFTAITVKIAQQPNNILALFQGA
jgi:hypothetical protein